MLHSSLRIRPGLIPAPNEACPMPNPKHAYLILAHGSFRLLSILLEMLDDERNDLFLHIDAKTAFDPSMFSARHSRLFFVPDDRRIDVRWGDVSQIHAEYEVLKLAHQTGDYAYYHLISGVDLPIKSQDYIHAFCDQSGGKLFVGFVKDKAYLKKKTKVRIMRYHLLTRYYKSHPFLAHLNKYLALFLSFLKRPDNYTWASGPNWFSITSACVEAVLAQEQEIKERFRHTFCGDEFFLQSLIASSPQLAALAAEGDSKRLIDWKRGRPYVWRMSDREEIAASDAFFARKFDEKVDMDIVYWIKSQYKDQSEQL